MNLDDLIGQVHSASPEPGAQVGVIRLQGDAEVEPAVGAIVDYFGTYADRDVIRIVVGDDEVGYLDRQDAGRYDVGNLGFGDSARALLPGLPFGATAFVASGEGELSDEPPPGVVEMRCPIENCPENPVYMPTSMLFAGDPLTCRVHRQRTLELHVGS